MAASSSSSARLRLPTIPPGPFMGPFSGPFVGVAPWQNVLTTTATCVPFGDSVTCFGAGAQVRNCGAELVQLNVTVVVGRPGIGASINGTATWPPGETGKGVPGLPPAGGTTVSVNGTDTRFVESLAFAGAEPPPVTVTMLTSGVGEFIGTFTVTVIAA